MDNLLKKVITIAASLALIAFAVSFLMKKKQAELSPLDKVEFKDKNLELKMVYCQPFKKGRLIFGSEADNALQPYGQYWRLGANDATTLDANQDLLIEGNQLPKGVYSVYAVPGKETWTFGFNTVANRWGKSEPDYNKVLFTVVVPVAYTSDIKEQFTISIQKDKLIFWWDTSKVIIPFEVVK